MHGPQPKGHWTHHVVPNGTTEHQHLRAGLRYLVKKPFRDFDGDLHAAGECWTFLGASFLPHDDGLSLFVSFDDEHEWNLRMQWTPHAQAQVLDDLASYVAPA